MHRQLHHYYRRMCIVDTFDWQRGMLPITISRHLHLFHRCYCYANLRQASLEMLTRTVKSGEALVMCGENTPCFSLYILRPSLPGKFFLKVPTNGRGVAYSKSITGKLQSEFCNRESPCPTLQAFVATPDYPPNIRWLFPSSSVAAATT